MNLPFQILTVATILAVCGPGSSSSEQELTPGEIVVVGKNAYKLRVTDDRIDVADRQAMKRAREYCARMHQTVVVKDKLFEMGFGYMLTWSCAPS